MLLFKRDPRTQGHKILSLKTRVLVAAHSEDFVILSCLVLTQYRSVLYGHADRWTDTSTMARRAKHSAVMCKNVRFLHLRICALAKLLSADASAATGSILIFMMPLAYMIG